MLGAEAGKSQAEIEQRLDQIRASYAKGVEDLAKQIAELQASHRATIGAVAALDKIIEEATATPTPPTE